MENQENIIENITELPRSSITEVKQRINTPSPKKTGGLKDNFNKEVSFTRVEKIIERKSPNRTIINQVKSDIAVYKEEEQVTVTKKKEKKKPVIKEKAPTQPTPQDDTLTCLHEEINKKSEAVRLKETEKRQLDQNIKSIQKEIQGYKQRVEKEKEQVDKLKTEIEEMEVTNHELDEMIESLDKKGCSFKEQLEEKQQLIDELLNKLSETNYEIAEIKGEA